jgi:trans-aconitate methyltransferase
VSRLSATLFTWLQGADFYRQLHREAVEKLPLGNGTLWLDVGCGPGLTARLAASRGYRAIGIDAEPHMIHAARRIARREGSAATFMVGDVEHLADLAAADVVSAASLLAVLNDPSAGLHALWKRVAPGGTLLVIEPTHAMTQRSAHRLIRQGLPGKRRNALRLWALAREGRAVDPSVLSPIDAARVEIVPLLRGLVAAWVVSNGNPGPGVLSADVN